MPFHVFEADAAAIQRLEQDDVVARQSLVVRDGAPWGIAGKVVLVEGSEDAVRRAAEIVAAAGGRVSPKEAHVKAALDEESDAGAGGVGFIFGP